ncbi:leucine-rich repeat domain-containing protein [Candidatus Uabimicrobium sp. HlEnr_7]|uniref:leucine-rich repeat domain-containing protein n=1 Tax=Candidatus Uabimicrobium helgolandensis TaxID=3095367 RepID=UPI0035585523
MIDEIEFSRYENFDRDRFLDSLCEPRLEYWYCIYRQKLYPCWIISSKGKSDLCIAYSDFGICKAPWGILINWELLNHSLRKKDMGGDDTWGISINDVFDLYIDWDFPIRFTTKTSLDNNSISEKKKNITEIRSHSNYCACTFYITNVVEDLQESTFENCSFRGDDLSILMVKNCKFINCNFNNLNVLGQWSNSKIIGCHIQFLNLCSAYIEDQSLGWVCDKSKIQFLDLSQTRLKNFPQKLLRLPLIKLNLALNDLEEIPKEIINLEDLQELYLCGNKLRDFPNTSSINLHTLAICGNHLEHFCSNRLSPNIKHLDISHNRIRDFTCKRKLSFLDISGNLMSKDVINRISLQYPFAITKPFFDWNWGME